MNFAQIEFAWFFLTVLVLYWSVRDRQRQNFLLVVASAVFYGWVQPWFVLLLFGSATLDFFVGLGMRRFPHHRNKLLAVSLAGNLGALFWFKYFDFFVENVAVALEALGVQSHPQVLGLYLPIGISFYTFQTLSYTIDVHRRVLEPRTNYLDYLTFVTLFPQLVAGPIERAVRLLPQCEKKREFDGEKMASGFGLALFGLFKKVCIADTVAPFVDQIFALEEPAGPVIWMGAAAFGTQVYADLSGYTDMARGTARMLGFELARNFDEPMLATSTPDFWRRWHITVSSWFRDYLMVPMIGGTGAIGLVRLWAAVLATFLIIGIWHGAGWNYAAFGVWHAIWVLIYLGVTPLVPQRLQTNRLLWALAIFFHLSVVSIPGSILFREPEVTRALSMMATPIWEGTTDDYIVGASIWVLINTLSIPLLIQWAADRWLMDRLDYSRPWWPVLRVSTWGCMIVAVVIFYRDTARDFIYFQF